MRLIGQTRAPPLPSSLLTTLSSRFTSPADPSRAGALLRGEEGGHIKISRDEAIATMAMSAPHRVKPSGRREEEAEARESSGHREPHGQLQPSDHCGSTILIITHNLHFIAHTPSPLIHPFETVFRPPSTRRHVVGSGLAALCFYLSPTLIRKSSQRRRAPLWQLPCTRKSQGTSGQV